MTTEELIKKYLYIPVEGEKINTDRHCPPGYPYIRIYSGQADVNRQITGAEHVALLNTGQLVYMDSRVHSVSEEINLGLGVYHHTVVRK